MIKTCIVCPKGCRLDIKEIDKEKRIIEVTGNGCKRGIEFAQEEMYNPKRTLQTTVETVYKEYKRLPVKTSGAVPKDMMFDIMREAKKVLIDKPVKAGDVIIGSVLGTGTDLTAAATMRLKE